MCVFVPNGLIFKDNFYITSNASVNSEHPKSFTLQIILTVRRSIYYRGDAGAPDNELKSSSCALKKAKGWIYSFCACIFSTLSLHLQSLKLFVSGFQDGLRRLSGNEYIFSTKREFTKCIMQLWHRVQIFHYIFFPAWVYIIYFCTFCVFCILYCSTAWISKKTKNKKNNNIQFPSSLSSSFEFLLCHVFLFLTEPHHLPSHLTTPLSLNDIPPRIAQTMENEDSWDFDIFNLEAATLKRWGWTCLMLQDWFVCFLGGGNKKKTRDDSLC